MSGEAIPLAGEYINIREVSLRDGLQIEEPIPLADKIKLLEAIVESGVKRVELTAFVSPRLVPALADAADLAAVISRFPGVEFSALVASVNGAHRAIDAGVPSVEYVISASESHGRNNVGRSVAESIKLIEPINESVSAAGGRCEVIIATAWDCPFDGPTESKIPLEISEISAMIGVQRISLADTIGTATPGRVGQLFSEVQEAVSGIEWGGHFHNTRGSGLVSAYAAVQSGVKLLDASFGGLGGCPFAPGASGNIATEELVYMLHDSGFRTDLNLTKAIDAAAVAAQVVGHEVPSNLLRSGDRIRHVR